MQEDFKRGEFNLVQCVKLIILIYMALGGLAIVFELGQIIQLLRMILVK